MSTYNFKVAYDYMKANKQAVARNFVLSMVEQNLNNVAGDVYNQYLINDVSLKTSWVNAGGNFNNLATAVNINYQSSNVPGISGFWDVVTDLVNTVLNPWGLNSSAKASEETGKSKADAAGFNWASCFTIKDGQFSFNTNDYSGEATFNIIKYAFKAAGLKYADEQIHAYCLQLIQQQIAAKTQSLENGFINNVVDTLPKWVKSGQFDWVGADDSYKHAYVHILDYALVNPGEQILIKSKNWPEANGKKFKVLGTDWNSGCLIIDTPHPGKGRQVDGTWEKVEPTIWPDWFYTEGESSGEVSSGPNLFLWGLIGTGLYLIFKKH